MTVAFDTSVLVAAIVESHPLHAAAIACLDTRRRTRRIASWHAIAEAWAVLTAMPLDPPVTGELARVVLERLRERIELIVPTARIYSTAVARCVALGQRSGAVFDALHLVTAEAHGADLLLTFNLRDFERLSIAGTPRVASPTRLV